MQRYISRSLPASLPKRKSANDVKAAFPVQFAFQGFCPVTYADKNNSYEGLTPGDTSIVAEFDGKWFTFASEEKLAAFMQSPLSYATIPLPKKLPPRVDPVVCYAHV